MPLLPAMLILISCFTHAAWNLMARHRREEVAFFRRMLLLIVPMSLALVGAVLLWVPYSFPARTWAYMVPSGFVAGAYFYFLALAYDRSDFTIVYPVARALPLIMLAGIDVLRGHYPTSLGWLAMLAVMGGCVLAPQDSYSRFDLKRYHLREVGWIILTAATIVGFTLLDKVAQEGMLIGTAGAPGSAMLYCGLWHICATVAYLVLQALHRREVAPAQVCGWRMPALAAVLGLFTYTLVLWAYQLAVHTSYVVAFRQFSIVVGVVASFIIHREAGAHVRLPATGAIVGGLVLLVLWG